LENDRKSSELDSLTDSMPSLNVTGYDALVVHPANNKLVAGLVSGAGAGLLQSSNAGNTWQVLANSQFEGQFLTSLAVDPTDQQTMYLSASWFGAWQSADGGQTWQQMTGLPSGAVWDLVLAKYDSNTLFAAVVGNTGAQQSQNGVYKSTDGGATWTLLGGGLPSGAALGASNADGSTTSGAVRIESGATQGVVYVSMLIVGANPTPPPTNAVTAIQRFSSGDGGASWTALQPSSNNPEFRWWHLLLGVDPGNAKHVFVNDAYSPYESQDGGQTLC
jgi:Sortilin, neurotensin receptor 3,